MAGSVTLLPALIGLMGDRISTTRWRGVVASALVALALFGIGIGLTPLAVGILAALVVLVLGSIGGNENPLRRKLAPRVTKPLRDTVWYKLSRLGQRRGSGPNA